MILSHQYQYCDINNPEKYSTKANNVLKSSHPDKNRRHRERTVNENDD